MSYNILGINPGHNGSACLVSDGELKYYVEEERLSRMKYDGNPFKAMVDIMNRFPVDELVIVGTHPDQPTLGWTGEDIFTGLVRKFYPNVKTTVLGQEHHLTHAACAFYNSGFDKAVAIVVDGAGTFKDIKMNQEGTVTAQGFEAESVWTCEYPAKFNVVHKVFGDNVQNRIVNDKFDVGNSVTITKAYEAVTNYLGFSFLEAGKTMGLSSYGKPNNDIPELFKGNRGSKDVFIPNYPQGAYIDEQNNTTLQRNRDPKNFHNNPTQLLDIEKDLAYKIQKDTEELVGNLIQQAVAATGLNKVVISGGYGLNCVTNYYLKKRFPNIEIYNEPISHDGGTAIGGAKLVWHGSNNDNTIRKQTTINYGPEYSQQQLLSIIESVKDSFQTYEGNPQAVAQLLSEKNIVAIYQGRSEAGPRALGNRSIMYTSTDPNGKDFVNKVKGREWFRPFAGSVLKEHAKEYFDLAGMDESPFMMYAVDVLEDKKSIIPAITHVDGTCRVQTVDITQNKNYYDVINEFYKITGVPVIFNTSFNLAGHPLVETLYDAIASIQSSQIDYLYIPEVNLLLGKK
jgi:carbamoyltransferase